MNTKNSDILFLVGLGVVVSSIIFSYGLYEHFTKIINNQPPPSPIIKQKDFGYDESKLTDQMIHDKLQEEYNLYGKYLSVDNLRIENSINDNIIYHDQLKTVIDYKYGKNNQYSFLDELKFNLFSFYGYEAYPKYVTDPDTKINWYIEKQTDRNYKITFSFTPNKITDEFNSDEFRIEFRLDTVTNELKPLNTEAQWVLIKL